MKKEFIKKRKKNYFDNNLYKRNQLTSCYKSALD